MVKIENLRSKVHKLDDNNYIDKKIEMKPLDLIQNSIFDIMNEYYNKKIFGKTQCKNLFEGCFLDQKEEIPIYKEFEVCSRNNQINFVQIPVKRINIKETEFIQKPISRSKSFTFSDRSALKNNGNHKEFDDNNNIINFSKENCLIQRTGTPSFEFTYEEDEPNLQNNHHLYNNNNKSGYNITIEKVDSAVQTSQKFAESSPVIKNNMEKNTKKIVENEKLNYKKSSFAKITQKKIITEQTSNKKGHDYEKIMDENKKLSFAKSTKKLVNEKK